MRKYQIAIVLLYCCRVVVRSVRDMICCDLVSLSTRRQRGWVVEGLAGSSVILVVSRLDW